MYLYNQKPTIQYLMYRDSFITPFDSAVGLPYRRAVLADRSANTLSHKTQSQQSGSEWFSTTVGLQPCMIGELDYV